MSIYLDILLRITCHDSLTLSMFMLEFWPQLLRVARADHPSLRELLTAERRETLFLHCLSRLVKVGSPSSTDHPSSKFSRMDFDSEEDWFSTYSS